MRVSRVLCSQQSSLCRCPTGSGLSSVPLESQQGAEPPFLCKVSDSGGATRATCQKGPFPGTSHKVQRPSQCPDHPLQTNHSGISPGFQFRHCWDPLLHSVTLGGWHCDRPGVPGIPSVLSEAQPPCPAETAPVVPGEGRLWQGLRASSPPAAEAPVMTQLSPALFFSLLVLAGCGNLNPPCSVQALEGTSHFSPHWLVWFRPSCLRPQR